MADCEGFGADFGDDDEVEAEPPTPTDEPLREYTVGESAETEAGNTITVYSFQFPAESETAFAPDEGKDFAVIDVEGCAGPEQGSPVGFSSFDFTIQMADNTRWESSGALAKEPGLSSTRLTANDCARGFVTFEVAQDQEPAFVVFDGSSIIKWAIE